MNNPPEPYDPERHSAWLASLSPDESLVIHAPCGYLSMFFVIALTKRCLLMDGLKAADQLHLLERLNAMIGKYLTAEMLAMIEPASDLECKIIQEARSLDAPSDRAGRASFEVLTSPRVSWHLISLNPSILAAIKWREKEAKASASFVSPGAEPETQSGQRPHPASFVKDIPERFWNNGR